MDERIDLLKKIKLKLMGHVYVGEEKKEGWSNSLPLYLFECPKHGIVKDYAKGFHKRIECPKCLEEKLTKHILITDKKNNI